MLVLPEQDFATERFLEAWSAKETSGCVSIRKKIIKQVLS
jgi:hypothetical protein